jgi:predicted amidohydrolase
MLRIFSNAEEQGIGVIVGHVSFRHTKMLNSATVILPGGIKHRYDKTNLTDAEKGYFTHGNDLLSFTYKDCNLSPLNSYKRVYKAAVQKQEIILRRRP